MREKVEILAKRSCFAFRKIVIIDRMIDYYIYILHIRRITRQPRTECLRIPRLHKYRSRTSKLANQTLTREHVADNTTRGHALENILAVPSNQVPVVDDILFIFLELIFGQS